MKKLQYRYLRYIVLILLVGYVFFFSGSGYFQRIKIRNNIAELKERIEYLTKENLALKKKIISLKNDADTIAELARKLGYARKGEKIYRFKNEFNTNLATTSNSNSSILNKEHKKLYIDTFFIISVVALVGLIIVMFML